MKKYFLLATTTLLLGTSNVMAETGDIEVEVNVSATVKAATTFEKISDMKFGTMYVAPENLIAGTKLAILTYDIELEPIIIHHENDHELAMITAFYDNHQFEGGSLNIPVLRGLNDEGTLVLNEGLEVRNMHIIDTRPASIENAVDIDFYVGGALYLTQDGYTGTGTGVITVGIDYE